MDDSYTNLPTSHLLGSVPAVTNEAEKSTKYDVCTKLPTFNQVLSFHLQEFLGSEATLHIFPPSNVMDRGQVYQTIGSTSEETGQESTNTWRGYFDVLSYTQYFNVDTDIVLNRLISSLNPTSADFFNKIDANPDLYGAVWISTTLIFMLASFGNCATYLTERKNSSSTSWSFDVSYFNVAACLIYIYATVVPLGFYFLLQYLGSSPSLIRLWCMWGYSLFYFVLSSFLLVIPLESLRWLIILITGGLSASFVGLNIRSNIEGNNDISAVVVAAFVLQLGLALFIKIRFFP